MNDATTKDRQEVRRPAIRLHCDLSTRTGEEFLLFTLAAAPGCRKEMKKGT
jgi:hypothetical protein